MKKILAMLLALMMVLSLCACGKQAEETPAPAQTAAPVQATVAPAQETPAPAQETPAPVQETPAPATTIPTPEPATATPEPTPDPTPADEVEWQIATCQWEDSSGYTFEATIKISPWINTKNEAYVTAAWNEVGNDKALPSDDSELWGNDSGANFVRYRSDASYRLVENVTDVYYCVGNVTIKNLTTGWDITASSPIVSNPLFLSPCQPETDPKAYRDHPATAADHQRSSTIGEILYSNEVEKSSTWVRVNPKYTSNEWGPVPFIFAHFESKAPAYPEGKYISEITDTYFCINSNSNFIENKEMSELTMIKMNVIEQD